MSSTIPTWIDGQWWKSGGHRRASKALKQLWVAHSFLDICKAAVNERAGGGRINSLVVVLVEQNLLHLHFFVLLLPAKINEAMLESRANGVASPSTSCYARTAVQRAAGQQALSWRANC